MKNLKLTVIMLLFTAVVTKAQVIDNYILQSVQNSINNPSTTLDIFNVNPYGINNILPTTQIKTTGTKTTITNYNNYGILNLYPSYEIKLNSNGTSYTIYRVNQYGIVEYVPIQTIKVKTQ